MRYRLPVISWGIVFLVFLSQTAIAANYLGAGPGDGADSNPATFHFDNQNQDFQMTQPDETPLADTEAQLTYGTAWKIIYNNQDYVTSQGLSVQGTSLTGPDWTSLIYPPVGRLAIDPVTGRFKFAQTWEGTTSPLSPELGNTSIRPDLALNDSGYGFCGYYNTSPNQAYITAYDPQTGWQNAIQAESSAATDSYDIKVDINRSGRAAYMVEETIAGESRMSVNQYIPGLGWEGITTVDTPTGAWAHTPAIAMNDNGEIFVSYIKAITSPDRAWAARYVPGSGWYAAVTIGGGSYRAFSSEMAVNNSGTAYCVFRQEDSGGDERIWGNRYVPGAGWQNAVTLDNNPTFNAQREGIAVAEDNTAICVFEQSSGGIYQVYANVYLPGSGWQGAQVIDANTGYSSDRPVIAMNQYGVGLCVFRQLDSPSNYRMYANWYIPGSGWQGPVPIDSGPSAYVVYPSLDLNDAGEAICLFTRDLPTHRVYANKYTPAQGWTGAVIIDANTGGLVDSTDVKLNNRGLALAAFEQQINSKTRVFVNRYLSDIPAGPFQVNYSSADPAPTPDAPTRTTIQITNRKLEPRRGQQAVIQYALAESGMVSIIIYDLQGVLVKTLAKEYQYRGTHTLNWNASNADNTLVASGVYVVRFDLPGLRKTEKIVVIK